MRDYLKLFFTLAITVSLIYSCSRDEEAEPGPTNSRGGFGSENQYLMGEPSSGNGDRTLLVDIIQGTITFSVNFQSGTRFRATLKKPTGEEIKVLGEGNKPFKGKTSLEVSETGSYLLDVKSDGQWAITRE